MDWYYWVLVGIVIGVCGLFLLFGVLNYIDDRIDRRKSRVNRQRSIAEQHMQDVVQKTISEMFAATRNRL